MRPISGRYMETDAALSHSLARRLTDLLPLFGILAAISTLCYV